MVRIVADVCCLRLDVRGLVLEVAVHHGVNLFFVVASVDALKAVFVRVRETDGFVMLEFGDNVPDFRFDQTRPQSLCFLVLAA